ncbi:juvenile hormone acid O-methyltransferase [Rhipicephalus sanguineus]|uniref:juvenile hormone acid O-methyltransferase n=1 Tax=Rhipicephalus sanguineus TaxID=34632 RepID=UPI001892DE39|nr:juvenile hormone acid O-methyltransferase [Rhipicephalus sanguineus]
MLKYARQKYAHEKIVYEHLDIDKDVSGFLKKHGAFQRVYSFRTLQWSQDLSCALRNIAELLVPGGECLLLFFARSFLMESFKQMSRLEPWSKYADVLLRGVPKSHEIIDQKGQHAYLSSVLSSAGLTPCTVEVLVNPYMIWMPGASYERMMQIANPAFSLLSERERPAFQEALSAHLPEWREMYSKESGPMSWSTFLVHARKA